MTQVVTLFKKPKRPKVKEPNAASKRPGMDPEHLANIRKLRSCVSGQWPCEAHHLRCAGERGVGLKSTDRWAVPLCRHEHTGPGGVHSVSGKMEFAWFEKREVNCLELASALWRARGDLEKMKRICDAHRGSV